MAEHLPRRCAAVAALLVAMGCARSIGPLVHPAASAVALTGGPNTSMVYLARTPDGVVAIDLGWWRGKREIVRKLRTLGASPDQVTDVFLTHSHRDHIGAWPLVRGSRFHVAVAESPLLLGQRRHRGWIPRVAERLKPSGLPRPTEVRIDVFSRDTSFVFGPDTLFAFLVPGHTAGSAAYLFRGVLFLGDAATYSWWGGFAPARRGYSDSRSRAAASLTGLWERLPAGGVKHVCTAHAHCRAYSPAFLKDVRR